MKNIIYLINFLICLSPKLLAQENSNYPIFKNHEFKNGVYRTYQDFLANQPDTVIQINKIYIRNPKSKNRHYATVNNKNLSFKPWGFCDKGVSFVRINKKYYPLKLINNDFFFYEKANKIDTDNQFLNNYKGFYNDEIPFRFIPAKGTFEYYNQPLPDINISFLYIINSNYSEEEDLDFTINGKSTTSVKKGTYLKIEMSRLKENVELCIQIKGKEKECRLINKDIKAEYVFVKNKKDNPLYFEVQKDKKDIKRLMKDLASGMYELICYCFYSPI